MQKTYTLSEIQKITEELIPHLNSSIILLKGEMGAGKTTLIKALCKALNCKDVVSSPTFSLINEYHKNDGKPIYHFDCYRIENEEEAYDFGAEEYLYSGHLCLIEWPDNIQSLLPKECNVLTLEKMDETTRQLTLS